MIKLWELHGKCAWIVYLLRYDEEVALIAAREGARGATGDSKIKIHNKF